MEASESGFLTTLADLGARLRAELGAGELSAAARKTVRASLPSRREAACLYAEGLTRLRLFEAPAARDLLAQAAAVEPGNPLIHAALASAWLQLGYEDEARRSATEARRLAGGLPVHSRAAFWRASASGGSRPSTSRPARAAESGLWRLELSLDEGYIDASWTIFQPSPAR